MCYVNEQMIHRDDDDPVVELVVIYLPLSNIYIPKNILYSIPSNSTPLRTISIVVLPYSWRAFDFWLRPNTTVLKSPTGIAIGKSTDSRSWAMNMCQIGIHSAKLNAPPIC